MSDEKTEIQKRLDEIEQQLPELRRLFEAGYPHEAMNQAAELAHGLKTLAKCIDGDVKRRAYEKRNRKIRDLA